MYETQIAEGHRLFESHDRVYSSVLRRHRGVYCIWHDQRQGRR